MRLGGIMFIRNGDRYDYCWRETIACLKELCDSVVILDAGSDDGTREELLEFEDDKTQIVAIDTELWNQKQGKEKLAYFQNIALSFLDADYYFLLQADEVLHQDSFKAVRQAIATGKDAFMVRRINLWGDCDHFINVPQDRQPCSQEVIRLARTHYQSGGDGESIVAPANFDYLYRIIIYHYGFIRKREVMKDKIINMQENVFRIAHDPKLDGSDTFDSTLWFNGNELSPLMSDHPKFIKAWLVGRP